LVRTGIWLAGSSGCDREHGRAEVIVTGPLRRERWRAATVVGVVVGVGLGVLAPAAAATAASAAPVIRSVSPGAGVAGTTVTVTGARFTGATAVAFNGAAAVFTVRSPSKITAVVPAVPASTGQVTVTTAAGTGRSRARFTVIPAVRLSQATGPPTSTVQVSGTGFAAAKEVDVYFDATEVVLGFASPTGSFGPFPVKVPASATPGEHWISAEGRTSGPGEQVPFTVNTNWAQPGYSAARTGFNPYENVLSAADVSQVGQDWSYTTGGPVDSPPAVVDGLVYVSSGGSGSPPEGGSVYALNAATGARVWIYNTGHGLTAPAVANGVVYVSSGQSLYALNASTGAKLWRQTAPTGQARIVAAVANGVLYVSTGASLYALKASTGATLWSYTPAIGGVEGEVTVADGVVYVPTGNLTALNAATGAPQWTFSSPDVSFTSAPAVANGVVYTGTSGGPVWALNAHTGAPLWDYGYDDDWSSPTVADGVVYVYEVEGEGDTTLYALNASTGAQLWIYDTNQAGGAGAPAVANGVVYVNGFHGNLYALDASTGAGLWSPPVGPSFFPAVVNGRVYVGSGDTMYAFGLPNGQAAPTRPSRSNLHPNNRLPLRR
jgi:outer membrane protein assembly factor BamB